MEQLTANKVESVSFRVGAEDIEKNIYTALFTKESTACSTPKFKGWKKKMKTD